MRCQRKESSVYPGFRRCGQVLYDRLSDCPKRACDGAGKPDRYEDRLQVIRQIRGKVEKLVSSFGLDGSEIVADIASDYFEDYVNYKEPDIRMTNEEFLGIIQKVARE